MILRILAIAGAILCAGVFGFWVPADRMTAAVQPIVVAVSVMAAGVLVRLNRGMPGLDWKAIPPNDRKILTNAIFDLNKEYLRVMTLMAATIIATVIYLLTHAAPQPGSAPLVGQPDTTKITVDVAATVVGALLGLAFTRFSYIVWRDFDIVRLQKRIIDDAANKDMQEQEVAAANAKVANVRAAGLRAPKTIEPRQW